MPKKNLLAILLISTAAAAAMAATGVIGATGITYECDFSGSPSQCGFEEQSRPKVLLGRAASSGRATLTNVARDGATAIRLNTQPGDNNVFGSGSSERTDLSLSQAETGCYQGAQQWWAHSIRFPDDYVIPPSGGVWHWGIVFDFHHTGPSGQANLQIVSLPTGLAIWVAGGSSVVNGPRDPGFQQAAIGPVVRNTWYDFVYNVRWSSGSDGFVRAWVNGDLKMAYHGPTLYSGQGCYLKLANYHSPLGLPVSVIHDRVLRGTSAGDVSSRPLETVMD